MKKIILGTFLISSLYSQAQTIQEYYQKNAGNQTPAQAIGTVSNGTLINGKLVPFKGNNFTYFDSSSYVNGRAFTHDKVLKTMLDTYSELNKLYPKRKFGLMECSNQHGGKIFPHHTHQNGLSIDFMSPLVKNNQPYYGLDTLGANHYWLDFDNDGKYTKDKTVSIDFNLIAHHLLLLEKEARKNGLKISKVIFKIELKDDLFATMYGKEFQKSGIYIVQSLTPLINSIHDDHYHIDFELIK